MALVSERIPEPLQPEVDAALAWFNREQAHPYEVTAILDADQALAGSAPRELRLVLCGGDTCEQRSFRVSPSASSFDVAFAPGDAAETHGSAELQSELDPPPGARRAWLDSALAKHSFIVLVFYRGFW